MTQPELVTLVLELKCCSSTLAFNVAFNMINGDKNCKINNLILLNDYIDVLLKYDIEGTNCITSEEFDTIVDNATQICKLCDCE